MLNIYTYLQLYCWYSIASCCPFLSCTQQLLRGAFYSELANNLFICFFVWIFIFVYVGRRRIDRALDEAAGIFKQTDPSSSKILVLLTTGRQAPESDVTPFDVAIQPIKDMGTNTYVIAIGNEPSTRELRPLVSKAEDLFRVLFDTMESEASRVVNHIRKGNLRATFSKHRTFGGRS